MTEYNYEKCEREVTVADLNIGDKFVQEGEKGYTHTVKGKIVHKRIDGFRTLITLRTNGVSPDGRSGHSNCDVNYLETNKVLLVAKSLGEKK